MKKIKLKFEDQSKNWNIWENKSEIERSIQRVKGTLPEMECAKQLISIVKKIYKKGTIYDIKSFFKDFKFAIKGYFQFVKYL